MFFHQLRRIAAGLGYTLEKHGSRRGFSQYRAGYLAEICQPRTVIDVGVAYGTPELYKAFPSAYYILVEPLVEYRSYIDEILAGHRGEVHYTAVGERAGEITMHVNKANLPLSSTFGRPAQSMASRGLETRTVPLTTLDALVSRRGGIAGPVLLKIDTEGNELNVLKGARQALESIDFVIAEVSISKRFEGSYDFEELCWYMHETGFRLYTFLSIAQKADGLRPRFADVVFAQNPD